ncbi:GntP family permease [Oenococcus kitaharae]|uniref:D-glycerate transporter (Predicted) n=1 Tax=Oenococcus kitaharae DSM 17330 TaxID=1045004 RepID=G9WI73_9LACO|nr:GntP family permease [Oenococcus kitaharae]EHN59195.1 D-glycerate transporter (predicted) [Oenococcus kitaharae DSM 17330]OEY82270.1 gluconate:proton symporter [Oenococcus kitaharae]OEY82693.1 gluconate:proton symporter [Oenococcus kitaharae]OEY84950.1 gluconate:proton symporter [Oenococcus kitaharae]
MTVASVNWIGALIGLALAIVLILKKLNPVYSLLLGTVVGAIVGGASLSQTLAIVVSGTQSVMGTVVRVLAAGVLAGVMMESGAANTIARTIVAKFGANLAIFSLALATMIITAVGVFIPVAVLIVAPIAIEAGSRMHISKLALLVALSGGGKAGNIISPNPNTIAAAHGFNIGLSQLMVADFIPALSGLAMAVFLATVLRHRGKIASLSDLENNSADQNTAHEEPSFASAIVAPALAVVLLLIDPIASILHITFLEKFQVDAMYILPLAAVVGMVAMGMSKKILMFTKAGLARMTDVVLILIGAGAIGGLITSSSLPVMIVSLIRSLGISGTFLAPISGILMAAATASTSTGVILATGSFGKTILAFGTSPLAAAVMVHTGATVIDHLPQGNYFHVTANAMNMDLKERMHSVPYEALVGLTMTVVGSLLYGFL